MLYDRQIKGFLFLLKLAGYVLPEFSLVPLFFWGW